ncbi:MAG: WYL domain-containing protein [Oscillospiraceae bacterium]|nr:WYL domain-containing protein [Oscillospiraceae bacterium]
MELFSELYGCYYEVVAQILRAAPLSRRQAEELAVRWGYGESVLQLIPKLLNHWPLLEEREGLLCSKLAHSPALPVTALEQAWLKALLEDPRIRLFLTDSQIAHLAQALAEVEPLFRPSDLRFFDRYLDGDNYADPAYRRRFQTILEGIQQKSFLSIAYLSPKGRTRRDCYLPLRLEYSAKDDKFRLYAAKVWHGTLQGYPVLNLGRIQLVTPARERLDGPLDIDSRSRRCDQPIVLRVTSERNGIERFMVEFSSYEKQSEYDAQTKTCLVHLWYQKDDETEVLIRLLGFGPVLQILGPEPFAAQIRARVLRQQALLVSAQAERPAGAQQQ